MADTKISALTAATTPLAGTEVVPLVQSGTTKKVAVSDLTAGRSMSASTVLIPGNNTGITTGDPVNILRFTDTDTTAAAGQPMGRIEWVSSDAGFEGIKGYIQVEAVDGSPDGDMYFATQHNTGAGLAKRLKLSYDGDVVPLTGDIVQGTAAKGVNFTANTPAAGMTSQLLNWYEEGTFTPTITGETTNPTVGYSTQQGYYTRIGRLVTIHIRMTLSSYSGGSGNALISGLPFTASGTGSPFPMYMELGNVTLGAGYTSASYRPLTGQKFGRFNAVGSGVGLTALPVSALTSSSDIIVSGTYIV